MEEALAQIGRNLPDVALIDIGLPGMSGIEGTRLLKERYPNVLLLILTVYDDDDRIFEALCAGACGYLLKKTPSARLLESLTEAMDGGAPMSPEIARRAIGLFPALPTAAPRRLSPHAARSPAAEDARAGAQLHERRRRARRQLQHDRLPHAEHLSEAAGALEVGGGREGAARRARVNNSCQPPAPSLQRPASAASLQHPASSGQLPAFRFQLPLTSEGQIPGNVDGDVVE